MFLENRIHRRGDILIGRLRHANRRFGITAAAAKIGGQLLDIGQFSGGERAEGFFDFSDRHIANLAHAPHRTNLHFPR